MILSILRRVVLLTFLIFLASENVFANPDPFAALNNLQDEILLLEKKEIEIRASLKNAEASYYDEKKKAEAADRALKSSLSAIQRIIERRVELNKEIDNSLLKEARLEKLLRERYMSARLERKSGLASKLLQKGEIPLHKKLHYISALKQEEDSLLNKISSSRRQRGDLEEALKDFQVEEELRQKELAEEKLNKETASSSAQKILEEIRRQEKDLIQKSAAHRAKLLRVESTLRSGLNASSLRTDGATSIEGNKETPPQIIGNGLIKGNLKWPLSSKKIVRPFSQIKGSSRGIEIQGTPGEDVFAVANGEVAFKGYFPTFGNVVLLSHGNAMFSLYGFLDSNTPEKREQVAQSVPFAKLAKSSRGRLYLEFRKGKAVLDPSTFY